MSGSPKLTPGARQGLRTRGFDDGLAGRPKRSDNPEYLTSYRRGQQRAAAIRGEGRRP